MMHLIPMLINGYRSPAAPSKLGAAQLLALDDLFARYTALTLLHILPALVFLPLEICLAGECTSCSAFCRF